MSVDLKSDLIFISIVLASIVLDLFVFSDKNQNNSIKKALWLSLFWVVVALAFSLYIYFTMNAQFMIEYITAYVMEKSLSLDNIFVFILLLSRFKISEKNTGTVLFWGIILAIIFRVILIYLGVGIVLKFHWVLSIFGIFLLYSGFQILFEKKEEEDISENKVYKIITKLFPVTSNPNQKGFIFKDQGKYMLTQVGLLIILIGIIDVIFAIDSIPTVLAISHNQFVVITSNVMAVLGMKALYVLLKNANNKFDKLNYGIGFVLMFIGVELILEFIGYKIPAMVSLCIILFILGNSILASIQSAKKSKNETA